MSDHYPFNANGDLLPGLVVVNGRIEPLAPEPLAPEPLAPEPLAPSNPEPSL